MQFWSKMFRCRSKLAASFILLWLWRLFYAWGVTRKTKAIVLSTRHYHYDVAVFISWHLLHLEMDVEIWTRSSLISDDSFGAITMYRDIGAKVVDVGDANNVVPIPSPDLIDLLVIVSADEASDFQFLCKKGMYEPLAQASRKVLMIVHMVTYLPRMGFLCRKPHCTILVLARHVLREAQAIMSLHNMTDVDVQGVSARAYPLPPQYLSPVLPLNHSNPHPRPIIAIQGTLISERRLYVQLFECLKGAMAEGLEFSLFLVGWQDTYKVNSSASSFLPPELENITTFYGNLPFQQFFPVLHSADYMVAFSNPAFSYHKERATSTVPTGLNCLLPLVLPQALLKKYACLHVQELHRKVSRKDDCSSLLAALRLGKNERWKMHREVRHCRDSIIKEIHTMFTKILAHSPVEKIGASAAGMCNIASDKLGIPTDKLRFKPKFNY